MATRYVPYKIIKVANCTECSYFINPRLTDSSVERKCGYSEEYDRIVDGYPFPDWCPLEDYK